MSPTAKPALRFKGRNPTADLALFRPGPSGPEVLLIVRSATSPACPGLAAFPGGFVNGEDKDGGHEATETPEEAGRRELTEETGLVAGQNVELLSCGAWRAPWRDPRNDAERFVESNLFCAMVPEGFGPNPQGLDDAKPGETAWIPLSALRGATMAFDHGIMLAACCARLGLDDPGARSWSQEALWASDKPAAARKPK